MRKTEGFKVLGSVLLAFLLFLKPASAGTLVLPGNTKVIEEEAFLGDTSLAEVVLPEGIEEIGSRAFAESSLVSIRLPESLVQIADDALEKGVQVAAEAGTYAYAWAVRNGFLRPDESPLQDFTFSANGDGTCTVTGYTGADASVVIPGRNADGLPVRAIGDQAFEGCTGMVQVTLPDTAAEIGSRAFAGCTGLKEIRLSENTESIGSLAFSGCTSLISIELPDRITSVGDNPFAFCDALSVVLLSEDHACLSLADGMLYTRDDHRLIWVANDEAYESRAICEGTEIIGGAAFAGCRMLERISVPDSVTQIRARAFEGCVGLQLADIPGSVTDMGENVFDGCPDDLLIRTEKDSAAYAWARAQRRDVQAETTYRALLIGQSYEEIRRLQLRGPENDLKIMASMLGQHPGTPYEVTSVRELTEQGMLDAIADTFAEAEDADVSLLYYSGHGIDSSDPKLAGSLLGCDDKGSVSPDELRTALDGIKGRKIVIIDACFSGNMISEQTRAARSDGAVQETNAADALIRAFSKKSRRNLAADDYFVLVAAAYDENSWEDRLNGKVVGLFTNALVRGAEGAADVNQNGSLTLDELYRYAAEAVQNEEHAQVYPENCTWFGILREELPELSYGRVPAEPSDTPAGEPDGQPDLLSLLDWLLRPFGF